MTPLFNIIETNRRAAIAQTQAECEGLWCFRWSDGDEWEPVDGEHLTEGSARSAVRNAFGCDDSEFIVDAVSV